MIRPKSESSLLDVAAAVTFFASPLSDFITAGTCVSMVALEKLFYNLPCRMKKLSFIHRRLVTVTNMRANYLDVPV
jgi:hypothetical protein